MRFPDLPRSYWHDSLPSVTPEPALRGDVAVDIAIIGGGFTGLMTAYELLRAEPTLRVAVLEAQTIGYGASGRNGSFGMTVVGLGFGVNAWLRGRQFVKDAHVYMERAVDRMAQVIQEEHLDCDYTRPGFLRVATTPAYVKRLQNDIRLIHSLGVHGIDWLDADTVRSRVNSPRYLGAMWEPRLVLVHPLKLVRAEKRLAQAKGAQIFENTPVVEVQRMGAGFWLHTPQGKAVAKKVLFATNAYSHLFPQLRRRQTPAFTYMIATEPLRPEQLAAIGWEGGEGLEDARNLIHYYRITPDRRVVIGGGPVGLTYGGRLDGDVHERAWQHLERHLTWLFPSLQGVRVTHRWGGPFSVTLDLTPALGYMGGPDAVYSLGCIGHGVSMSHLNAQVLCDLLLERKGELLACPFVNRRVIPWPPEPLRMAAAVGIRTYLQAEDRWHERGIVPV
ncbi:MAG: NAD(P)/FAD-dependent oxidoreductase [Anaerolineae bacterium]